MIFLCYLVSQFKYTFITKMPWSFFVLFFFLILESEKCRPKLCHSTKPNPKTAHRGVLSTGFIRCIHVAASGKLWDSASLHAANILLRKLCKCTFCTFCVYLCIQLLAYSICMVNVGVTSLYPSWIMLDKVPSPYICYWCWWKQTLKCLRGLACVNTY